MLLLFLMILLLGELLEINNQVELLQLKKKFISTQSVSDVRETANIQPHGGAWMPSDRSFDRILFWYF